MNVKKRFILCLFINFLFMNISARLHFKDEGDGKRPRISKKLIRRVQKNWKKGRLSVFDPVFAGTSQCHLNVLRLCSMRMNNHSFKKFSQDEKDFLSACFLLGSKCVNKENRRTFGSGQDGKQAQNFLARECIGWICDQINKLDLDNLDLGVFKCDRGKLKEELLKLAKERKQFFKKRKADDDSQQLELLFPLLPGIILFLNLLKQTDFPVVLLLKLIQKDDKQKILSFVKEPGKSKWKKSSLKKLPIKKDAPIIIVCAKTTNTDWGVVQNKELIETTFSDFQLLMAADRMQKDAEQIQEAKNANEKWFNEIDTTIAEWFNNIPSALGGFWRQLKEKARGKGFFCIGDNNRSDKDHTLEIEHILPVLNNKDLKKLKNEWLLSLRAF